MPHAYVSVTNIKGTGALNIDGAAYDTRLRQVAEAVSLQIDRFCGRTFAPYLGTFEFERSTPQTINIPDMAAVGTVLEDTNDDGTYETGWATTDYYLRPRTANPTADWGGPYTYLEVNTRSDGTQDEFLAGQMRYKISGTWGYSALLVTALPSASGSLADTTTSITVSTAGIEPGQTILIDTEILYVRATATTACTVDRGVRGSTAGTHASGTAIKYYDYPGPIKEAAMIQASRLWKRRESGYSTMVGVPETGQMTTWSGGLDKDVKDLLMPFKRFHV